MNDYLAPIAARLTLNGAFNLRDSVLDPCPHNPDAPFGSRGVFTGFGKWTTLAARGVENNLISLGLAERREPRTRCGYTHTYITPLGREVAAYITEHWDDLTFRDPLSRR